MVEKATRNTYFPVGTIVKSHGLRGEVKVRPLAVSTDFLINGQELIANFANGDSRPLTIQTVRSQGQFLLLTFAGINDRTSSEVLQGVELAMSRGALPALEEGEFYLGDLIGYQVEAKDEGHLGKIQEVWDLPANEVLQVINGDRETLIPLVDEFIEKIDHDEQRVIVRSVEGLLD